MAKREGVAHGLTYVAAPYSHESKEVVAQRMQTFKKCVGQLSMRYNVVSPLFFHDVLPFNPDLGSDWEFWKSYSDILLRRSDRLVVLCIPGWTSSEGVAGEIEIARALNYPVGFAEVKDDVVGEILWQPKK